MEINNKNNTLNFKAIPIAATKNKFHGVTTKIDLYRLTKSDNSFIRKFASKVNFNDTLKNLNEYDRKRWRQVFDYAVDSILDNENNSIIAFSNNIPCGILSFFDDVRSLYLDVVCNIPQGNGRKVNFCGTTLIYQLFKYADILKVKNIILSAVTDGPFDNVSKYKRLGFKDLGMEGNYVKMSCNQYKIKETLDELSSIIDYKPLNTKQNVRLEDLVV